MEYKILLHSIRIRMLRLKQVSTARAHAATREALIQSVLEDIDEELERIDHKDKTNE